MLPRKSLKKSRNGTAKSKNLHGHTLDDHLLRLGCAFFQSTSHTVNMAIEIEHKFLMANDNWRPLIYKSINIQQGYLTSAPTSSIRVRISGENAWLNIKSATIGNQRLEFEYKIPLSDAKEMIAKLCKGPLVTKIRHFVKHDGHTWEIDEFSGENEGLTVAEIELSKPDEDFSIPDWIGKEVTGDLKYYNNNLAHQPYKTWK